MLNVQPKIIEKCTIKKVISDEEWRQGEIMYQGIRWFIHKNMSDFVVH